VTLMTFDKSRMVVARPCNRRRIPVVTIACN